MVWLPAPGGSSQAVTLATRREFLSQAAAASIAASSAGVGRTAIASTPQRTEGVVQTVLGPLDASKLGFTLTHEHICRDAPASPGLSKADLVAKAVSTLEEAKDAGIDTLVDVTPFDVGRNVRFGQEVSRKSGMQIVACTGQHFFAPASYDSRSVQEIAETFIREIEKGIDDTDIRAGVIKVASRSGVMTPAEEKVFRAAARASKATGISVQTHTNSSERGGEAQAAIFEAEGLSPGRVSLGHSNDTDDLDYLIGLARRGYMLGMDHAFWGMAPGAALSWQKRVECIKQLVDAGFINQLFLSNDWVFGDVEREKVNPDGLLYTTRRTIPYLKRLGVTDPEIGTITVENPRRFFGGA
jgi:phosphotriesterase-related protein